MAKGDPVLPVHVECEHLMSVHRIVPEATSIDGPYACEMTGCPCVYSGSDPEVYRVSRQEAERDHGPELTWLEQHPGLPDATAPHAAADGPAA